MAAAKNVLAKATLVMLALSSIHVGASAARLAPLVQGGPDCSITCPANQTAVATSASGAVVTYPSPTTTSNCATTCSPPSGSTFPVGTTTVTCSTAIGTTKRGLPTGPVRTPEVEPNNTFETAMPLDLVSQRCVVVTGSVAPSGDVDVISFTALEGDKVWIDVDAGGAQQPGANSRDTLVTLFNADGSVVDADDDDGTSTGETSTVFTQESSAISGAIVGGGTYFVAVEAKRTSQAPGVINPYALYVVVTSGSPVVEDESNDTSATATILGTASGQIGVGRGDITPGDVDWYRVEALAGDVLYASLDGDPTRDDTGTNLTLELADSTGASLLPVVNSSGAGGDGDPPGEAAVYRVATSGAYFAVVRHVSSKGSGDYNLMVTTCSAGAGASQCSFTVTVTMPFAGCCVDDYSGDTFATTVGSVAASDPLYGFWEYHVASTNETFSGTANTIAYRPGLSLVLRDSDDPHVAVYAQIDYTRHTCLVQTTDRVTGRQFTLRDRNTSNSGCTMPPPPRTTMTGALRAIGRAGAVPCRDGGSEERDRLVAGLEDVVGRPSGLATDAHDLVVDRSILSGEPRSRDERWLEDGPLDDGFEHLTRLLRQALEPREVGERDGWDVLVPEVVVLCDGV